MGNPPKHAMNRNTGASSLSTLRTLWPGTFGHTGVQSGFSSFGAHLRTAHKQIERVINWKNGDSSAPRK